MSYCIQNQTVKEMTTLRVKDKHCLPLQTQLVLKLKQNIIQKKHSLTHCFRERYHDIYTRLLWEEMWKNTASVFPSCTSFFHQSWK